MEPKIQTLSGKYFDYCAPDEYRFNIKEIAQALALTNRFGGHTSAPYSVAQHSVLVSRIVPPKLALWGLLHDAHEAYVGDIPSPFKQRLPDFVRFEKRLALLLRAQFGLIGPLPFEVKQADVVMLATERRDLLDNLDDDGPWSVLDGVEPCEDRIKPWGWKRARQEFMSQYRLLIAEFKAHD